MIFSNQSSEDNRDWHSYYTSEVVSRLNMDGNGEFVFCGQKPEPRQSWNSDTSKYDGSIIGYGYWVSQNYVDEETGQLYQQNPVLVIVDGPEVEVKFGSKVTFENLGGYYSRKKHSYSFRADEMKVVSNG